MACLYPQHCRSYVLCLVMQVLFKVMYELGKMLRMENSLLQPDSWSTPSPGSSPAENASLAPFMWLILFRVVLSNSVLKTWT